MDNQIQHRSVELGISIPSSAIDRSFRREVYGHLNQAHQEACELMSIPYEPINWNSRARILPQTISTAHADERKSSEGKCRRCGIDYDQRTRGCTSCTARHASRRLELKRKQIRLCKECGCPTATINPNCILCLHRARVRKCRAKKQVATATAALLS